MVKENKDCKTGLSIKLPLTHKKLNKNMLQIDKMKYSNAIGLAATHVVTREDFHKLDSIVERKSELYGKIRMLIHVGKLNGVLLSAFWEDLKMSVHHPYDFEKVAIISSNRIEEIITKTTSPLVNSKIQVFREPQRARQWILNS
ncbi:MAG: STAS/SEC14 domain-containing protein [Bacteroidetes bacterium]|nr:STAS/SEC14 domain-containing protein [Bacteroidota bacterium]